MKIIHKALVLSIGICASLISSALMAAPLIKAPHFACGAGTANKQATPGSFNTKTGLPVNYTFDRVSETVFEGGQVRPIALSPDGNLLFVANTPANCLEIFDVRNDKLQLVSSVAVGVEPVSVAVRDDNEVWVVNHISDSVSVVEWNNASLERPRVVRTLLVGDEPRDIVFADGGTCTGGNDKNLALITTANRGQHSGFNPLDLFRDYIDNGSSSGVYDSDDTRIGRASVWVFDATDFSLGHKIIPLFSMPARGLAVSPDGCTVYAAALQSGNQTTVTLAEVQEKKHLLFNSKDRRADGLVNPGGNNVIVRYDDSDNNPTDNDGIWRDGETGQNWNDRVALTPADYDVFKITADENLWDDPEDSIVAAYRNVGTTLFNVAVNPQSPYTVYVSNIEARNDHRYVGEAVGTDIPETLQGHFADHNITVLDPSATCVTSSDEPFDLCPSAHRRNLNDHITNFLTETNSSGRSMAQPTDMVVTSDGDYLYVANFGSKTVSKISTAKLTDLPDPTTSEKLNSSGNAVVINLETLAGGAGADEGVVGGGPAGLALNGDDERLYVYSRFDNALMIIDVSGAVDITSTAANLARATLYSPESDEVKTGRPFLYDASMTSKNGTGSCGSCHIYGDMDMLAWDLGNPSGPVLFNGLTPSAGLLGFVRIPTNRVLQGLLPPPFDPEEDPPVTTFTIDQLGTKNLVNADATGTDFFNDLSTYLTWFAPKISSITRSSGDSVTVTTTHPHSFSVDQKIDISGVNANFNGGPFTITSVSASQFSYTASGTNETVSNQGSAAYSVPESAMDDPADFLAPDKFFAIDRAENDVEDSLGGLSGVGGLGVQLFHTTTSGNYLRFYPIASISRDEDLGVVTVTVDAPYHHLAMDQNVVISGVTDTSFNGTFTITGTTATTFTYAQTGSDATSSLGEASPYGSDTIRAGDSVYLCYVSPSEIRLSKNGSTMLGGGACDDRSQDPYFVKWSSACERGGEWPGFEGSDCTHDGTPNVTPDSNSFIDWHPSYGGTQPAAKTTLTQWNGVTNKKDRAMLAGEREVYLKADGNIVVRFFEGATIATGGIRSEDTAFGGANTFHPLKGPMTTQTLRGIADSGAMHWRGDKSGGGDPDLDGDTDAPDGGGHCAFDTEVGLEDCSGTATYPQETAAFKQFNEAFIGLLGRASKLSDAQMNKYTQFVLRLTLPPNPIANLDGTVPGNTGNIFGAPVSAQLGGLQYMRDDLALPDGSGPGATNLGGVNCVSCHALNTDANLFGTDKTATFEADNQFIKVPHLRNAYQKVGMFYVEDVADSSTYPFAIVTQAPGTAYAMNRPQVAGFGYNHDGIADTLINFFDLNVFQEVTGATEDTPPQPISTDMIRAHARNIAMFVASFSTNVPPITGQQVTLRQDDFDPDWETNGKHDADINSVVVEQMDVLFTQAIAGKCDLIATAALGGESGVYRMKGDADACGYSSGADQSVCFDAQFDGPTYVPYFTDGTAKAAVFAGDPMTEMTFTCLPKRNNDLRMRYDSTAEVARVNYPNGSYPSAPPSAVWEFSTSPAVEIRAFIFARENDATMAFPQQMEVWGSNTAGPINPTNDELLMDMEIPVPALNAWTEDLPIKQSAVPGTTYQYYKTKVTTWYCPPSTTCTENVGDIWNYSGWHRVSYVTSPDSDSDGLTDASEFTLGTNPFLADTDADGMIDGDEVALSTDPFERDSDGDGWCDGSGSACVGLTGNDDAFPTNPDEWLDTDGDGLGNNIADSDDDGDCIVDGSDAYPLSALSGSNDCTFDTDGLAVGSAISGVSATVQLSDGKLMVAGYTTDGDDDFAIARYNKNGSLDTSFGTGGVVTIPVSASYDDRASAMILEEEQLVIAGYASNGTDDDFAVVRCNLDGTLDTTFSTDGIVVSDVSDLTGASGNDRAMALVGQSDNKVAVAGYANDGSDSHIAVVRYTSGGLLDTDFNPSGTTQGAEIITVGSSSEAHAIVQQSDGQMVLAGWSSNGTDDDVTLVRLNVGVLGEDDGSLDTSFDTDGIVVEDHGLGDDRAYTLVQQASGKLVIAGRYLDGIYDITPLSCGVNCTDYHVMLMRFDESDGSLDTGFGSSGIKGVDTTSASWDEQLNALIIDSNNNLVAAGRSCASWNYTTWTCSDYDFLTMRFDDDGVQDSTFNEAYTYTDGVIVTDNDIDDEGHTVLDQADEKLVTTGFSGSSEDAALMRYHP